MKGIQMKFRHSLLILFLCSIFSFPSSSFAQNRDANKVYNVAILPFLIHSQENLDYLREGIYDILSSRITVEGKIVVIERSIVERALYEERPMRLDETVAKKIGTRVGADYIVLGSLTKIGNYISLDARLISITEEKPPLGVYTQHKGIDDVMVKIGDFAQDIGYKILGRPAMARRPAEPKYPYLVQPRKVGKIGGGEIGFKQSQTFNFEIKGLDIGDVDGDKKNELVIMDRNNLYVFKYDGEKMSLFQKIEAGNENNFLTLDVADLNQNGHAEIIVTSVIEDEVQSFILEYEEGRFRKITEKAGWFFRVLDHPKEGPILLGQQRGAEGLPVDPIYRMVWRKKSFEKGPKMPFPKGTIIFGLTMADIRGKGKPEIITLDQFDRLDILSENGKIQWTSSDLFGGTNNYYDTLKKRDENLYRSPPPWRVYIPGRILVKDLNGDGIPQLIVNKNDFGGGRIIERMKVYEKGEIRCLSWDENELTTNWKTREIKGYIADYQVKDVDNDGDEELVVASVGSAFAGEGISGAFSRKSTSNIFFFKLF
jgi:TolB-like protein